MPATDVTREVTSRRSGELQVPASTEHYSGYSRAQLPFFLSPVSTIYLVFHIKEYRLFAYIKRYPTLCLKE